ncbi:MAG: HAD family hydrolase [Gammaproteobacteria bacterium]|uniref:HAD family hydrolase n=1 Tax=Rhodoferax sp. TaxID=50421 RepID=UPI0018296883|nr:HAD family hydrolase [Rhodoferax sp.]MBU3900765.1 HAD family hydrolase [Gammaproteobacteria bacterium]MBA3056690.1 HAD family hydrolase [Rhodoferax sp.]MBU3996226.1 HAD family hydrolase [Gammaproteobacteria bacterium]MBU4079516.1 HAD family hydrolase [Gammaproteobacteria bacterium]MBU4114776.1 HAD family hydrolase [Gammaproteobacteria bacterium]
MRTKPLIALDADGVLLDYNLAYATVWGRFAGADPAERDANAYWHIDRWDVERLTGERLAQFRVLFDAEFWTSIPPIAGAIEACQRLHEHDHELVCVSALDDVFAEARLKNLRNLGFPIERVFATGNLPGERSPKAQIIDEIKPVAFVDDYLPYMSGIRDETHTALILRGPNGSPNVGPELTAVGSTHADLAAFGEWWLART